MFIIRYFTNRVGKILKQHNAFLYFSLSCFGYINYTISTVTAFISVSVGDATDTPILPFHPYDTYIMCYANIISYYTNM